MAATSRYVVDVHFRKKRMTGIIKRNFYKDIRHLEKSLRENFEVRWWVSNGCSIEIKSSSNVNPRLFAKILSENFDIERVALTHVAETNSGVWREGEQS